MVNSDVVYRKAIFRMRLFLVSDTYKLPSFATTKDSGPKNHAPLAAASMYPTSGNGLSIGPAIVETSFELNILLML